MRSLRVSHVTALVAILALASACTATASATPTASATATAADAGAADSPSADASRGAAADPGGSDPWAAHAVTHRGSDGDEFEFECPPNGEANTVWGTDVYTDDSSVCTAAVHAGVITLEDGGDVRIEIRPGEDTYEGSERNGITTHDYASWGGSFEIVDPDD